MNGHLNVAFYAQIFDSACWAFLERLAGPMRQDGLGWADVQHTTRFLKEVSSGANVLVHSSVLKLGRSSLVTQHELFIEEAAEPSASVEMATVRFDLSARASMALEPELREAALAFTGSPTP